MDEIVHLKKQVKMLSIVVGMLVVAVLTLLIVIPTKFKSESWPDLTVGKLTAKQVFVVSPDGHRRVILFADDEDGGGTLGLTNGNEKSESGVLLHAGTKMAWMRIDGAERKRPLMITNTQIQMGDDTQPSFRVLGPSAGGPSLMLQDEDGFSVKLGRAALVNRQNGTQTFTSTATIVGGSKESSSQWPLLKSTSESH
jgi:hypothetical protein